MDGLRPGETPQRPGRIARLASLMVGAVAVTVAAFLGALALAVVLGFAVIAAGVFAARVWWLRRRGVRPVRTIKDIEVIRTVGPERQIEDRDQP